jgi:hypothetical protein
MQDIREIYEKTKSNLEDVLSRHVTELQQLEFVLDNDIVGSNGDPLPDSEMADVLQDLNTNIDEVKADIGLIKSQITYITKWLESYK